MEGSSQAHRYGKSAATLSLCGSPRYIKIEVAGRVLRHKPQPRYKIIMIETLEPMRQCDNYNSAHLEKQLHLRERLNEWCNETNYYLTRPPTKRCSRSYSGGRESKDQRSRRSHASNARSSPVSLRRPPPKNEATSPPKNQSGFSRRWRRSSWSCVRSEE